ncbi:hypothetical protein CSA80_05190 [Candidatus Saccharibacteria bacterium]|nr:MAG: hypothetical protein CSA80_05190 [Candidatus Saccharibacteria bacterium]
MKRTKRKNPTAAKSKIRSKQPASDRAPLSAHLREVKRRLFFVALSVIFFSIVTYSVERRLIEILLAPSHGQHFVYTSPMGGINFLFNVCFYFGVALSIPVIIYNLLKFVQPIMRGATQRFIILTSIASGFIGIGGILFGYFAGLPAALHFLLKQQFHNGQVEALISIEKYFSFVVAYMFAAALMFQLPLLLIIINRIKQLTPKQMLKYERGVILFSFISAFIMNPTPNVVDQMLTVIPVLVSYQLGIVIVWLLNKRNVHRRYATLFDQDEAARKARAERARAAERVPGEKLAPAAIEPAFEPRVFEKRTAVQARRTPVPRPVSAKYTAPRPNYAPSGGRMLQL